MTRPAALLLVLVLLGTGGCYTQKIEKAFDGEFSAEENNRIINDYCIRCHVHRNFQPGGHVDARAQEYNRKVFRLATECRTCHYIEKKFSLNDFARKTRRPKEANEGKYSEFERAVLKAKREQEKETRR